MAGIPSRFVRSAVVATAAFALLAAGCSDDGGDETVASTTTEADVETSVTTEAADVIGYVGCSNTAGAVAGAHADGESNLWPELRYAGGTIVSWQNDLTAGDKGYWDEFDAQLAAQPTDVFWVQICVRPMHSEEASYDATLIVIDEIRSRVPDATVYISTMNGFVAPHVCSILGAEGPERMASIVERVVAEGVALRGPDVGDLISVDDTPSEGATAQNTETRDDGCHPADNGAAKLGAAIDAFPAFAG